MDDKQATMNALHEWLATLKTGEVLTQTISARVPFDLGRRIAGDAAECGAEPSVLAGFLLTVAMLRRMAPAQDNAALVAAVKEMRAQQKEYCRVRSKGAFIRAVKAESVVDQMLEAIGRPVSTAVQPELFGG